MNLLATPLRVVLLGIALGAIGCGSSSSDYCTAKIDCEGGNDQDIEACEIARDADEDIASVYGCEPEWDDYFACWEDRGYCDRNPDRYTHRGDCDRESERLNDCIH